MTLPAPAKPKAFGSLKRSEWPETDRRLLDKALMPNGFLKPGGTASGWRSKTLETVIYRYGVFVWWLRDTGRLMPGSWPIERITAENIETFVADYGAGHASTSLAGTLHGVYEATRVMHPEADLAHLLEVVGALKAEAKPRPKLPRMADQNALFGLGEAMIEHGSRRAAEGHMLSAAAVRDGCMILFQVDCPIRRSNFEGLRLGRSLLREDFGYRVAFGPTEMKNHQPFDATLSPSLTPHLDFYVDVARPALQARSGQPDKGYLWLGAEGEPMTGKAISRRLRQLIERHLDRPMSIHLFRDTAATSIAVHHSAHIGIVGDILGHSDHATSEKHYNQARGVEAARRYHQLLREQNGSN